MAYTYEDFTKRARQDGLFEQFSAQELATAQKSPEYGLALLSIKKDLAGATTDEQRLLANAAAEQLYKTYGGTTEASSDGFVYSREDDYKKLFDSLTDPDGFAYDYSTDPAFSAYKKARLREADRSMRDTLASASGATGGVPSSYAVTAAQQARDYEASKIGDVIPELYEAAYGRQQDALSILTEDRENAHAEYLAALEAAEAARQAESAAQQQQIRDRIEDALGTVGDAFRDAIGSLGGTVQDTTEFRSDPAAAIRENALNKLLSAGNPYNAAVGSKLGTSDRLDAIRPGTYADDAEQAQQEENYAEIRSAALQAVASGKGFATISPILKEAMENGEITYTQYVTLSKELGELIRG